ncbi:MAG TPA: VWA domain-containing protein [Candidatus Limnocylindrales bacterium]|nr:VWA domain-containing protein [Candidatus Limnocylindrales bacterium]
MIFQKPEWLWGSILIPLILLGAWYAYRKREQVLADPWIQMHLRGSTLPKRRVVVTRWILYCIVYLLFLMVLAEPMKKKIQEKPVFTGIRITFLLDTSLSMAYARDLEPSRLAVAKKTLQDLVDFLWSNEEIGGNYQVAVIPFAGAAFPTSFLFSTSPYEITSYIQAVDENTIDVPGTSLQAAIVAWEDLLSRFPADSDTTDVGILISDGGKEGGSEQNRLEAIRRINDLHTKNPRILLYTVGIGKIKEDALGVRHAEEVLLVKTQDEKGRVVSYYRTNPDDPTSSIQTSSLDEEILRRMAVAGGGSYYYVEESSTFYTSLKSIILSQRKIVRYDTYEEYTPLRTWFLVPLLGVFSCLAGYGRWILIPLRKVIGRSRRL